MITITKHDIDNVIHNIQCPAHYSIIFSELCEVYDYDNEYTISTFLQPFELKRFMYKVPFSGVNHNKSVRYADYLIPLFYAAYGCKSTRSPRIIKEVLGMYLHYYGHFQYPESAKNELLSFYGEGNWNDFHNYWGDTYPKLTQQEQDEICGIWFTSQCINRYKPKKLVQMVVV
jgi:hypothetical protein